jgi:hypothetical protein
LEQLLAQETTEFDLEYGFVSHIDRHRETERFELVHGSHELLQPNATVPLGRTYCRKTIAHPEGTLAVSDASAEGWDSDPAYETFELGSYLGTTVAVGDDLYGTLCFANTAPRDEPFQDEEKALLELHSQWVEVVLAGSESSPTQTIPFDAVAGRTVSSDAIDAMMDALRSPIRRGVLLTLLNNSPPVRVATLEAELPEAHSRTDLYHHQLPKLDAADYIKWDDQAAMIAPGPNFDEVEPLLRLLHEYKQTAPR